MLKRCCDDSHWVMRCLSKLQPVLYKTDVTDSLIWDLHPDLPHVFSNHGVGTGKRDQFHPLSQNAPAGSSCTKKIIELSCFSSYLQLTHSLRPEWFGVDVQFRSCTGSAQTSFLCHPYFTNMSFKVYNWVCFESISERKFGSLDTEVLSVWVLGNTNCIF